MKYQRKKFLKQLGVVVLIAVLLKLLPGFLVFSIMSLINLAITIALVWILYRLATTIYKTYNQNYYHKHRPPRYWSDRR